MRALVSGENAPPGFDSHRVEVQAAALRKKRGRMVAASTPDLVEKLGKDWEEMFDAYARYRPVKSSQRRSDSASFRRWLN